MKYLLNFIIAFFLFISVAIGQFNPAFEEFLEEMTSSFNPVGLSISVRSGDKVWNRAIGISSVDDPLSTSSILAMGSITKTFISAGILKLMEENRLTLSNPIHQYLPSFANIDSTITIKELLNHTSGVYDYSFHPDYFPTLAIDSLQFYTFSPEEILANFVLEKAFDRGTMQEYSNTNYILLGMIITEIANRPYYEEIFEAFNIPQNYPSISCPPFNSDISELANLWADFDDGFENISAAGFGLDGLFSASGAAGAFVGSVTDLSQWGYDLYSGRLLSEPSMDSLLNFSPPLEGYGIGVINYTLGCGIEAVGHNGAIFYGSDLAYSEEFDLSVAVMTNDADADADEDAFPGLGTFLAIKDEIFCAYREILLTNSVDIRDQDHMEIDIYPNPAQDDLYIKLPAAFDQSVQVEVYNELGALVYAQEMWNDHQQAFQIDHFSALAKGVYFIRIFDKENSYMDKFIKL